jgi:DNA-binding transcriptional LysR family regulator
MDKGERRMDRMTSMATFVKVVDMGGFSAAGRALNMSATMATNHVQSLEERLGVRLLNRSTRKLSTTEVGRTFYERAQRILGDVEDAERNAQALQTTPRGILRLNTSVATSTFLAPVIAKFVALNPEVSISMSMSDREVDLVEEGFDLAIRNMPIADSSLISRRVASYHFILVGAPEYFAKHGKPVHPSDLVSHNCLTFLRGAWDNEWRFSGPGGELSVPVSGNMQSNCANAIRLASVHAQGLTILPSFLVADDLRAGRLASALNAFLDTEYAVNASYPSRHRLSAKVRSFIDFLARHCHEDPAWADPCNDRLTDRENMNGSAPGPAPMNVKRLGAFHPAQFAGNS